MRHDDMFVNIAAAVIKNHVPANTTLEDRVKFCMRYALEHESDLFFMTAADDELMLKAAVSAAYVTADEAEKDRLLRSFTYDPVKPLRALSAFLAGVPVDMSMIQIDEGMLPIVEFWHQIKEAAA